MFTSLLDILTQRAKHQTHQRAFTFLQDGELESESLTYGELEQQSVEIAAHLQPWKGARAVLMYPSGFW